MRQTLARLDGTPGILDALVMTPDGVLVTSLHDEETAARTAALASLVLLVAGKEASGLGSAPSDRLTIWASDGRLIILPLGEFVLVVKADSDTELGQLLMEVATVPCRLARSARLPAS